MNQHRAHRHKIAKKHGDVQSSAGIDRDTRLRVQIMVQTNQRRAGEKLCTLRDHRMRIAPNLQIKITAKLGRSFLKAGDALVVILEDENCFHRIFSQKTCWKA